MIIVKKNDLFEREKICGMFSELSHVSLKDAELIHFLRTQQGNNFLRETPGGVDEQISYLKQYLIRFQNGEEIYYKIRDKKAGEFVGVIRLTQIQNKNVINWQSLVVKKNAAPQVALDVMLLIYGIAFDWLGREVCGPWQVKKDFKSMMKMHKHIGIAEIVSADDEYYEVRAIKEKFNDKIDKFRRMGLGVLS